MGIKMSTLMALLQELKIIYVKTLALTGIGRDGTRELVEDACEADISLTISNL